MTILGEAALSDDDKLFAKFADEFESAMSAKAAPPTAASRRPSTSAGELLSLLPRRELKRVKPEMIDKYMPKK